ncbi:uncharacterized protein LODBEIA_P25340 [Lodderomyces beijingensis]|uniref:RRM domain-containing protein n=1 Tax=Lodderomyces beijingensis TaxID=1775926 RepID=A0ABP0ZQ29_9ASCO
MLNNQFDQLNLSRTIVLKNLCENISLHQLLDNIDFGPIEYIKLFTKQTPKFFQNDGSLSSDVKTKISYISFINSKIAVLFYLKYAKNQEYLSRLKQCLKSDQLKIHLNDINGAKESSQNSKQDYIKLKTLNYILDFQATRCLALFFKVGNLEAGVNQEEDNIDEIQRLIATQCEKFGDIEDFQLKLDEEETVKQEDGEEAGKEEEKKEKEEEENDVEEEDDESQSVNAKVIIHFTSIDSCIRAFESYTRSIQHATASRDSSNLQEKTSKYSIQFTNVQFEKDRCDRTPMESSPNTMEDGAKLSNPSSCQASNPTSIENGLHEMNSSGPLDNSSDISSFIDSPERGENEVSIVDPVSPNSSDIEGGSPILQNVYAPSDERHHRESVANGSYSMVSESSGFSHHHHNHHNHHNHHHHHHLAPQAPHAPPSSHPVTQLVPVSFVPATPFSAHSSHSAIMANNNSSNGGSVAGVGAGASAGTTMPGNRSLYLGNLHPNTTVEEIANNVRAGGLVECINYIPERRICFITFVDPNVAYMFYMNHQVSHQLVIHGYDITVSWAKQHSGPLHRDIALAVTAGASRNVYLGIRPAREEGERKPSIPKEQELRENFSRIGHLEQINFYHNKDCAFLNFINIADAIALVESFESDETTGIFKLTKALDGDRELATELYHKYCVFKISYAKDRCGNPPRFSFKKKLEGSQGSTYQQYSEQLHSSLRKYNNNNNNKNKNKGKGKGKGNDEEQVIEVEEKRTEEPITAEAALVFGIVKTEQIEDAAASQDTKPNEPTEYGYEEKEVKEQEEVEEEKVGIEMAEEEKAEQVEQEKAEQVEQEKAEQVKHEEAQEEDRQEQEEQEDDEEEEEDDEEDDDEVSIIIGSDETASPETKNTSKFVSKNATSQAKSKERAHSKYQKVYYHNSFDSSYSRGRFSRNSSTVSVNSGFNPPFSPYVQAQSVYYAPPTSRNSSTSSFRASHYPVSPNLNYFSHHQHAMHSFPLSVPPPPPPPEAQAQQYVAMAPSTPYCGQPYQQVRYVPVIQHQVPQSQATKQQQHHHHHHHGSSYSSGSEVMAQYLNRSQQEFMALGAEPLYESQDAGLKGSNRQSKRQNGKQRR